MSHPLGSIRELAISKALMSLGAIITKIHVRKLYLVEDILYYSEESARVLKLFQLHLNSMENYPDSRHEYLSSIVQNPRIPADWLDSIIEQTNVPDRRIWELIKNRKSTPKGWIFEGENGKRKYLPVHKGFSPEIQHQLARCHSPFLQGLVAGLRSTKVSILKELAESPHPFVRYQLLGNRSCPPSVIQNMTSDPADQET